MRRFAGVVLIVACLSLSACKPNEKQINKINPIYYSAEECESFLEEKDYADLTDYLNSMDEIRELASSNMDPDTGFMSSEVFDEWVQTNFGNQMMYTWSYSSEKAYPYYQFTICDTASLHYFTPDVIKREVEPGAQGLYLNIFIAEDYDVDEDRFDSNEEFLEYIIENKQNYIGYVEDNSRMDFDGEDMLEISEMTYICCYESRVAYPYEKHEWSYDVFIATYDEETGSYVRIEYTLPKKDNEEEIQELRDLGIPIITDFIK